MTNHYDNTAQLAYAIEAAELATWDLDPVSGKFLGNDRLKEWFGLLPADDIPFQSALEMIAAKDRQRVTDAIQRALEFDSGGMYQIDYTIIHPQTGKERIVRAKGKTLFDDQQKAHRFNGILMDITGEVAARETRQKLLKLVENSVDLMSVLELNGANSYINAAGREILGIDADADVSLIPISSFHTPEQIAFVESEIIPNVMTNGKWAGEFAIRNIKTGEIIPLYNNCHRIDNLDTGEPIGVGAIMRNMRTEIDARNELERKVRERTMELQAANEALKNKNSELASFAYVSSHDLQEPLRKIRTFCERIRQREADSLSESGKDFFVRIENAALRMQSLIEDLLNYSRVGWEVNKPEKTDLDQMVSEVVAELGETIRQKNAGINVSPLHEAFVIPFQFRQVLFNLLTNSLKFTSNERSPQITISGEATGDFYQLVLSDNGIGFEPQYADKIFEMFQRLHGKHEFSGTGIGLAIVKKIVANHNGTITARGEPGKGARFEIRIPDKPAQ